MLSIFLFSYKNFTLAYLNISLVSTIWLVRNCHTNQVHISHKQALDKAHAEYTKYKNRLENTISPVEQDFIKSIGTLESIADSTPI